MCVTALNTYGTVQNSISIASATKRFDHISSMSERLVICLGAVDIVQVNFILIQEKFKNKVANILIKISDFLG